ncbi:hypothetical protein [Shuttleworthella sp. MSX8B]|uniref:hypothetical protein n=1 Tax=Shuttleworthella sp. MSX8B TaxID=936574 RepID=UPI0018DCD153|nr:hypothetical protein [Shuttleworthia sp. MSX8B]
MTVQGKLFAALKSGRDFKVDLSPPRYNIASYREEGLMTTSARAFIVIAVICMLGSLILTSL